MRRTRLLPGGWLLTIRDSRASIAYPVKAGLAPSNGFKAALNFDPVGVQGAAFPPDAGIYFFDGAMWT